MKYIKSRILTSEARREDLRGPPPLDFGGKLYAGFN
jgi:hypothetical protein